ncbi:LuxR C-terminal-related transcriptional regulator [Streptomyces sp. NPDC021212]|uniref:helix-turn-helix transcriptional regulator n=1 Tax=Streptomyces sp. NPDC021212 TaxID=3365118 RepID=UPI0037BAB74D
MMCGGMMWDFFSRVRDGEGQGLLIEATAGMGRTTELRSAVAAAPIYGLRVLSARARASESDSDYGVAQQLVSRASDVLGMEYETEEKDPYCPSPRGSPLLPVEADLHPLLRVLANDTPVLLAIDDLQWMDQSSLKCLGYLMARLENAPVALVATLAPGEAPRNFMMAEVLAGFQHRLVLTGLSREQTAVLAAEILGAPVRADTVESALAVTGGNPYLLDALFRDLRLSGPGPATLAPRDIVKHGPVEVAEMLLSRYDRTWPGAEPIAEAVAVLGEAATVPALARLVEADELAVADTVASLTRAGLLAQDRPAVRFAQPLVRTATLTRVPPSRRNALHVRAAHMLYESDAPREQIAVQILGSHNEPAQHWTCTVLSDAAREAVERGAYDVARDYLRRGLQECEGQCQGKLLRVLGQIELSQDPAAAAEYLRRALTLSPDPAERTGIRIDLAHSLYLLDRPQDARTVLDEGIADGGVDPQDVPTLRGEQFVLGGLGPLRPHPEPGQAAVASAQTGAVLSESEPPDDSAAEFFRLHSADLLDQRLRLDLASLLSCCRGKDRLEAVRQAERALRRPYTGLNERLAARTVPIQVLATADKLDSALAEADRLVDQATASCSRTLGALAYSMRAEVNLHIGNLSRALEDSYQALELMPLTSPHYWVCTGQAVAAGVGALVETARTEEAYHVLERFRLDRRIPERSSFGPLFFHRGRLRLADGDQEGGLADLLESGVRLERAGTFNPAVLAWRSEAALVYAARGDRQEARRLVDAELSRARRWGAPRAIGRALRAAGLLAEGHKGEAMLGDAVQVLESSPARLELARVLADLGIQTRRSSRLRDARDLLRRALSMAEVCGAAKLEQTVREELLVSGARPRRATEVGVDALTPTERRVALLAARKHTNRQIAASLFVAQRTVELHLSNAYRKLSITGRPGLAAYADELQGNVPQESGTEAEAAAPQPARRAFPEPCAEQPVQPVPQHMPQPVQSVPPVSVVQSPSSALVRARRMNPRVESASSRRAR